MRIATWNVNSIKSRFERVLYWLKENDIDTVTLQETKCRASEFPRNAFMAHGYHSAAHGYRGREGVAIVSRFPLEEIETDLPGCPGYLDEEWGLSLPQEARAIAATICGIRIYSLYIPMGRSIHHPHYHYKLAWLEALTAYTHKLLAVNSDLNLLLTGDFNIVLFDQDSADPGIQTDQDVQHTPLERNAFQTLLNTGVQDLVRPIEPEGFTFWDYRQGRFSQNQGLRIDHILGSRSVASRVKTAKIYRKERYKLRGITPSDHVPVMVEIYDGKDPGP